MESVDKESTIMVSIGMESIEVESIIIESTQVESVVEELSPSGEEQALNVIERHNANNTFFILFVNLNINI